MISCYIYSIDNFVSDKKFPNLSELHVFVNSVFIPVPLIKIAQQS